MPSSALLVIDMLNPYAHEETDALVENVEPMVPTQAEVARLSVGRA
jgi:hypothetical protein